MGRQADTYKKLFDDVRAGRVKALYFLHGPEEFMKREIEAEKRDVEKRKKQEDAMKRETEEEKKVKPGESR